MGLPMMINVFASPMTAAGIEAAPPPANALFLSIGLVIAHDQRMGKSAFGMMQGMPVSYDPFAVRSSAGVKVSHNFMRNAHAGEVRVDAVHAT